MMFPFQIILGSVVIPVHPLFEFAAFYFGYWYYKHLLKKSQSVPLSPEAEWKVVCGMAIGALVGAHLVASFERPSLIVDLHSYLTLLMSKTVAGGFVGAIIGVEIAKKLKGIKRRTGDLFVYPVLFAVAIGRLGCFLTGVSDGTTGNPSNLPWAFDQGDGILRHPTSAYEIILLLVIFLVLKVLERNRSSLKLRQGDLFATFMLGYFAFRFFVEFIKPRDVLAFGLSSIQIVSALAVIYYMYLFLSRLFIQNKKIS